MADPIQTLLDADAGPSIVSKANENFRRRHCVDVRSAADQNTTQLSTDELLKVSATTAARTLTLLPVATANSIFVWITAADGTNTYTIDADGSETIDGSATQVYTSAQKLRLVNDGTGWSVWTMN